MNYYGPEIPQTIAAKIKDVYPSFDTEGFLDHVMDDFLTLNLMDRGRKITYSLHEFLPESYPEAVSILLKSIETKSDSESVGSPIASFMLLPFTHYVATYGLDHFDESMQAQYVLTQRFTAEFSIRPFLERHTEATLARLGEWTSDQSEHVRRLVSEGTRTRLPWASRLPKFQKNPLPVLELLERLKDDESEYVRRSVANNLNDIGKDNPDLLFRTARRWMVDADENRRKLIRHALRVAVKNCDPEALDIMSFGEQPNIEITNAAITPSEVHVGNSITINFSIKNVGQRVQSILVDFRIHYIKANGKSNPKVFKLKQIELDPGRLIQLSKKVSLVEMTTRTHYPGSHQVDALINGKIMPIGSFKLHK